MRRTLILLLAVSTCALAQDGQNVIFQSNGPVTMSSTVAMAVKGSSTPVVGAPYSATITNETVQTLADGNRVVQTMTGTTARDSQGRTRQDAPLPTFGNLSAANAPRIVFIQDPVAQTSYTLDLTDKTAQKMPVPFGGGTGPFPASGADGIAIVRREGAVATGGPMPLPPLPPMPAVLMRTGSSADSGDQVATEDLGSQTMEGVYVTGTRTTRTIPAGQIGNEKPISIVNEVWTSPELKTIIYSKRSDPRMGDQTFRLTNISRTDPDPSLFTVPSDFKTVEGPQPIIYRANQ